MLFTHDLLSRGTSEPEMRRLRREASKIRHGVYATDVHGDWQLFEMQCEATLRCLKAGAALAGPAAAHHWGLPLIGEPPREVHVRGVARGRYSATVRVVSGGDPALVDDRGVRVTSVAWTVADCARVLPRREALVVADAALHRKLCTLADLRAVAAAMGSAKGIGRVRWIIANADPASESAGETWMRMVVRDLGYEVVSQHQVTAGDYRHRLDLLLAGTTLGLEFDGLIKYDTDRTEEIVAEEVLEEKRRQARIEAIGYGILRVIWEQLFDPATLDRRIRFALHGRVPRRARPPQVPPNW